MTQTFALAELDVTPSDAAPSRLTDQVVELDALLGQELLGHDDMTGNDAEGVLRNLQETVAHRRRMVLAVDRVPQGAVVGGLGLPVLPGRGETGESTVLGSVLVSLGRQENTDRAHVVLEVHPGHRRQGIGTALHRVAEELARAEGRTVLDTYTGHARSAEPGSEHALEAPTGFGVLDRREGPAAFALAHGWCLLQTETHSQLDPAEGMARVDALEAAAWPLAQGYEVVTWSGRTPEEHVEGMCDLYRRMSTDVPQGDAGREEEVWTPERVEANDTRREESGARTVFAMARHTASGQAVAYSYLQTPPRRPAAAYQEDTLVAAEHRGHRLGTLVKTAALRRAVAEWPQVQRIHTWNAGENEPMLAINTALGYRPVSIEGIWEKRLG